MGNPIEKGLFGLVAAGGMLGIVALFIALLLVAPFLGILCTNVLIHSAGIALTIPYTWKTFLAILGIIFVFRGSCGSSS